MKLQSVTRSALVRSSILLSSLSAVSGQNVCPGLVAWEIPYVQQFPVSISTYIEANTVFNINGNGYITINNAPTNLQTVVTASTTVTSTVTSTATVNTTVTNVLTASPTNTALAGVVTNINGPILISGAPSGSSRLRKRQQSGTFLGPEGQTEQGSCQAAAPFSLTNGQLSQGGELFSTDPGITYSLFAPSATTGSISTGFGANNGVLFWNNTAFDGGFARFCSTGGAIYAVFRGSAPTGCVPFTLTVEQTSSCAGYGASSGTTTPTGSVTGSASATGSGSATATASVSLSSSVVASSTASSSAPASSGSAPPVPSNLPANAQPVVVSFVAPSMKKRQSSVVEYLKADGSFTPDLSQAAVLGLLDGELFSGPTPYSTDPGTANQIFAASSIIGGITTTFTASGGLRWNNASFTITASGDAQFAVVGNFLWVAFISTPTGGTVVSPSVSALPKPSASASAGSSSSVPATSSAPSSSSAPFGNSSSSTAVPTSSVASSVASSASGSPSATTSAPNAFVSQASAIISSSSYTSFCSAMLGYVTASTYTTTAVSTIALGSTLSSGIVTSTATTVSFSTTVIPATTTTTLTSTVSSSALTFQKRGLATSTPAPLQGYNDAVLSSACSENVQAPSSTAVSTLLVSTSIVTSSAITVATGTTVLTNTLASTTTLASGTASATQTLVGQVGANILTNPGFEIGATAKDAGTESGWTVGVLGSGSSSSPAWASPYSYIDNDSNPGTLYNGGNFGHGGSEYYIGLTPWAGNPASSTSSTSTPPIVGVGQSNPYIEQDVTSKVSAGTSYVVELYIKGWQARVVAAATPGVTTVASTQCSLQILMIETINAATATTVLANIDSGDGTLGLGAASASGGTLIGTISTSWKGIRTASVYNPAVGATSRILSIGVQCGSGITTQGAGSGMFIDDVAMRPVTYH